MANAETERLLAKLLRAGGVAAVCRRFAPDDPALEGVLYEPQLVPEVATRQPGGLAYEVRRHLRLMGRLWVVTGDPLGSGAGTPFTLDGRVYSNLWWFAQALKLAEDDPLRAEVAAGRWYRRRRPRPAQVGRFVYGGEELVVDSLEHGVLIARATEAKVQAHPRVQAALEASGHCRMSIGGPWSGALGRWMPLALMLMRWRVR